MFLNFHQYRYRYQYRGTDRYQYRYLYRVTFFFFSTVIAVTVLFFSTASNPENNLTRILKHVAGTVEKSHHEYVTPDSIR